jgi:hypothetical protein
MCSAGAAVEIAPHSDQYRRGQPHMTDTVHNLLFQETILPATGDSARMEFLKRLPSQRKIDAFLKDQDRSNPSPRFGEFFDFHIGVFVAAVPDPDGTRVVVAGITNVTQKQFEQVAAVIGRGTDRWNRAEFKRKIEAILGISVQDPSAAGR